VNSSGKSSATGSKTSARSMDDAKAAVQAAQLALKQAEQNARNAGKAFFLEQQRWPDHLRKKAGF
jgi:hypothetical protein